MKSRLFPMKLLLVVIAIFISTLMASAQDIISMRNGDIIKAVIREISKTEIKYNRYSNPNGPLFIVDKTDVHSILYDNGEQETFKENTTTSEKVEFQELDPKDNDKNNEIISAINHASITHEKSVGGIKNANLTAIWGVKENSLISNNHITLSFDKFYIGRYNEKIEGYRFKLRNESSKTVYIDLTNSFFYSSTIGSRPFYQNKTYSQTNNSGSNVGFNIGALSNVLGVGGAVGTLANGLSIGGNKNNGNVVSESESPILIIPPYSFAYLPCNKVLQEGEWVDEPYILYFYNKPLKLFSSDENTFRYMRNLVSSNKLPIDASNLTASSLGIRKNDFFEFPPDLIPKEYAIQLTYIIDGDISHVFNMSIILYLRGLFGEAIEFKKGYDYSDFLIYGPAHILK